ncbi:MAG: methionyl-tRNA formyltransferase [Woeseiaceae bacterium]|nr:methionyl-tRNA formyltransferase [Woeseiaceae bacterium]
MGDIRVVFAGTPEFALASLTALVDAGVRPLAVLTQPDRPAGRGKQLTASPVKQFAVSRDIDVLQPASLRDPAAAGRIGALAPDILIVAAYGLLLPQEILDLPARGCVNVHASLLPRWRGAAPIQAAILSGDTHTGVCLMQMEAGLDSGPVYASRRVAIAPEATAGELHDVLAALGGELLVEHLPGIVSGDLRPGPQDESAATYAPKIDKRDAVIDWRMPAIDIDRRVRAYNPVPGANFGFRGERIKCWRGAPSAGESAPPGTVLEAGPAGIVVACGDGHLSMTELQRPGRQRVDAGQFAGQFALAGQRLA